ncbi:MAG: Two-component transcriptional response regulator, LuxR family [Cytophagales bacterium]|jgi:DNA-binding response OmpR family regulator|nr:response regulator transcription factor [Bacteroidota bacterium]MBS1979856.1 response regulator transcription factor [Bacteroidota bacterium]WHZ07142.1 MAG: Two-component transcriptional response regulator, LuxR family [Cytophagales bacterium]
MKILIIEDEHELQSAITGYLKSEGYICEQAISFKEASEKIDIYVYDCVLVDIGLPDGSGLQLVEMLKKKLKNSGVIIITAKNSLEDKISGLDIGADDYLTKPFNLSELNARIRSVLRRRKFEGQKEIEFNEIRVNPEILQAHVLGKPVSLTKKEFDLLLFFLSNQKKVLTKESIAEHLWGDYIDSADNFDFIYVHISNLRKKLVEHGARDYLHTVYGVGYKFADT